MEYRILSVMALVLSMAGSLAAQQHRLAPTNLFRFERVGAMAWSPDRQAAAVEIHRPSHWLDAALSRRPRSSWSTRPPARCARSRRRGKISWVSLDLPGRLTAGGLLFCPSIAPRSFGRGCGHRAAAKPRC